MGFEPTRFNPCELEPPLAVKFAWLLDSGLHGLNCVRPAPEFHSSVGEISAFLAVKVSLIQGLAVGAGGPIIFFGTLITVIVIGTVLGDYRLFLFFFFGYIASIVLLVVGQVTTGGQAKHHKAQGAEDESKNEMQSATSAGAIVGEVVISIRTVASFSAEERFLAAYGTLVEGQRRAGFGWKTFAGSAATGMAMASMFLMVGGTLWLGFYLMESDPGSFMGSAVAAGCDFRPFSVGQLMIPTYSMVGMMLGLGNNGATSGIQTRASQTTSHPLSRLRPKFVWLSARVRMVDRLRIPPVTAAMAIDARSAKAAAAALFKRIDRVSGADPSSESGEKLAEVKGDLAIKDVVFSYPSRSDFQICRGYSLQIRAGEVCALVTPVGFEPAPPQAMRA